ncbi:hypothetical protein J7L13_00565 [bacterium]|nr:hypothetical protein [bacterium]
MGILPLLQEEEWAEEECGEVAEVQDPKEIVSVLNVATSKPNSPVFLAEV